MLEGLDKLLATDIGSLLALAILFFAAGFALYMYKNKSSNSDGSLVTIQAAFDAIMEQARSTSSVALEIRESNQINGVRNGEQAQHHLRQMEIAERQTSLLDKLVKEMETHNIKAKEANTKNLDAIGELSEKTGILVQETRSTGEATRKMLDSIDGLNKTVSELRDQIAQLLTKTSEIYNARNSPVRLSDEDRGALETLKSNVDTIVSTLMLLEERTANNNNENEERK